jgi:HK97 family phage prohead protease
MKSQSILAEQIVSAIQAAIGPSPAVLHEPSFAGNEWRYLKECLDSTYVSSVGKFVDRFEQDLAQYTGAKHVVAVVNGTAALHIALKLAGVQAVVKCFDDENNVWFETDEKSLVMIADLTKIEPLLDTNMMVEDDSQRSKWIRAAWAIKGRIENLPQEARSVGKYEVRTTPSEFEVRDSNDGMTISGYAAVFNSPSEPLPFTERIAPGAFQRSLKSRNEIKLLWNHDSGEPMASLRGGSLRLWEDAKGLAYEATLANTTRGRDVAELIRSGVIDAMSFGFNVIKDTWDERGDRVLESVRIHEISVVAWPAYLATAGTGQVRSADGGIDAEALADALLRLESGEELESAHADLIKDVVSKLEKTPEVEEVSGNILDLKQKQLELLMKRV